MAPVVRFTRDAGVYRAQSDGHANRYQLFVERAIALTRPGGRIGLVLPSGLATDHGSAPLRRLLFSRCGVDAIVGIDNHRGVFPIHRSVRFLLVTASHGRADRTASPAGSASTIRRRSNRSATSRRTARRFPVRVSPALLERISGPGLALPNLRSAIDLAIVERAASLFPPLGSAARLGGALRPRAERERRSRARFADRGRAAALPVVEGKHLEPFRVALDAVRAQHQRRRRAAAAAIRSARASAARLPRRRQRHESPDAHRRGAAGRLRLDAHRLLPAHAAAVRARSTFSAVSSTASSSTTWCACA